MNASDIKTILAPVFEQYREHVLFAYLFGSMSQNTPYPPADIDIAVFLTGTTSESCFETRLLLYADLCRALKTSNIDLVVLNTTKNMMLLNEIIRRNVILFEIDRSAREAFEIKILHQAIDFREQRKSVMGV